MMQHIAAKEKKTAAQLQAKSAAAGFAIGFIGFKIVWGILTGFDNDDGTRLLRWAGAIVVGLIGAGIGNEIGKPTSRANTTSKRTPDKSQTLASGRPWDPAIDPVAYQAAVYKNKWTIVDSEICGCISCGDIFPPADIRKWVDDKQTACCPSCGLAAVVVGSASGLVIDQEMLEAAGAHLSR
ncbi:hypothetical protein [Chitinimonas sp.]|uniref:hypothetical protein n=1 Tax=Chitinimonas sp. TaxID=1934313 RepID=UPI002F92305F